MAPGTVTQGHKVVKAESFETLPDPRNIQVKYEHHTVQRSKVMSRQDKKFGDRHTKKFNKETIKQAYSSIPQSLYSRAKYLSREHMSHTRDF